MRPSSDLHTHTHYSHGSGSIADNVDQARKKGLKAVAVSDHGPSSIRVGINGYSTLEIMREEVNSLDQSYPDIKVLLGIEANLIGMDGEIDISDRMMELLDLLYVGFHLHVYPSTWYDFKELFLKNYFKTWMPEDLFKKQLTEQREKNTEALINALENYPVYMITHPGMHIDIDTYYLAKSCQDTNTYLEINSSHADKISSFVEAASSYQGKFIVSSDAHTPEEVGDLSKGISLCHQVGLSPIRLANIE